MNLVFGGGLWPIGWNVGFVEQPLRETHERYAAWLDRSGFRRFDRRPLLEHLGELLPLQMPYKRRLLVETASGWTAIFDNSRGGGDPFPPVSHLAVEASVRGVVAGHVPSEQFAHPATQFHLFGPDGEPPLGYVRAIDAGIFESGRWEFSTSGKPQPFEEEDAYRRRLVRERFTRDMLLGYLHALAIEADDPAFYGAAVLAEDTGRWKPGWTASLEQARAECVGERARS